MSQRYSDAAMLAELRRVAATVEGPLSRPKFIAVKPRISAPAITERFGSWRAAIEAAGLPAAYNYGGMWRDCAACGRPYRFGGGRKASKTCSRECSSELMSRQRTRGRDATPQAARGRAKRVAPGTVCERCGHDGSESRIERHHKDRDPYNNDPANVEVLCRRCHDAEHKKAGDGAATSSPKKLTRAAVGEICERYATGEISQAALAAEFGVTQKAISYVVRRTTAREINERFMAETQHPREE